VGVGKNARKFVDHPGKTATSRGRRRASWGSSSNPVATSKWPARAWHTLSGNNHCRWNKGPLKKRAGQRPCYLQSAHAFLSQSSSPSEMAIPCHTSGERRWQLMFSRRGAFWCRHAPLSGTKQEFKDGTEPTRPCCHWGWQ
jgi:hypothetical protein